MRGGRRTWLRRPCWLTDDGRPVTRASAKLGEGFPLRLAPQRLRHALGRVFGTITNLSTGDPAFDRAFLVDGMPIDDVRLALSPVAREHLLALVAMGAEVTLAKGKLRATVPGHAPLPEDVMEHVLAAARELSIGQGGSPYRS
jgi:hypothetical protein